MCVQYRYLRGICTEMSVGLYHVRYSYASHGPTYGIVGSRLVLRIRTLVRAHLYRAVRTRVRYSHASHGPTYGIVGSRLILRIRTLVRVHLYRAVRTKVRSRLQLTCAKGNGNSTAVDFDVAVEGARRGSRIRLVLGGDLHRLAGVYGFAGAG